MAGRRRASGGSDPGTLAAILNLGNAHIATGNHTAALPLVQEALDGLCRVRGRAAAAVTNEKTVRRRFARCGDASPPTVARTCIARTWALFHVTTWALFHVTVKNIFCGDLWCTELKRFCGSPRAPSSRTRPHAKAHRGAQSAHATPSATRQSGGRRRHAGPRARAGASAHALPPRTASCVSCSGVRHGAANALAEGRAPRPGHPWRGLLAL